MHSSYDRQEGEIRDRVAAREHHVRLFDLDLRDAVSKAQVSRRIGTREERVIKEENEGKRNKNNIDDIVRVDNFWTPKCLGTC